MAVSTNATYLADLVNPQVIADLIDAKLTDAIKFAPLAKVDSTLAGRPGNTITLPVFDYISKATVTPEGQAVTINKLQASTTQVTIQKLGNGVELTDESLLSGYGDPMGEAVNQLALSVADAIDDELVSTLSYVKSGSSDTTPQALQFSVAASGTVTSDDIANALTLFGEDIDGDKVVMLNAADYASIRKDPAWVAGSDVGADIIIKGVVGMIHGCQVVVSNRVTAGKAFIVKQGALALFIKRDTNVEADRDIINKSTVVTVDKHYATYLLDSSKAIYLK